MARRKTSQQPFTDRVPDALQRRGAEQRGRFIVHEGVRFRSLAQKDLPRMPCDRQSSNLNLKTSTMTCVSRREGLLLCGLSPGGGLDAVKISYTILFTVEQYVYQS